MKGFSLPENMDVLIHIQILNALFWLIFYFVQKLQRKRGQTVDQQNKADQ